MDIACCENLCTVKLALLDAFINDLEKSLVKQQYYSNGALVIFLHNIWSQSKIIFHFIFNNRQCYISGPAFLPDVPACNHCDGVGGVGGPCDVTPQAEQRGVAEHVRLHYQSVTLAISINLSPSPCQALPVSIYSFTNCVTVLRCPQCGRHPAEKLSQHGIDW